MKYLNILLLSLSSLFAIGCSGGDASEEVKPTPTVSDVTPTGVDEQLANYVAPSYNDDYTSIASWDNRSKWNLANVHDPSVMKADDGYYYMYQTDASYGNAHTGHGHFFSRRSKNLVDWEFMGATMSTLPSWVKTKLNEIRANMGLSASTVNFSDETQFGFWAPCARRVSQSVSHVLCYHSSWHNQW
jgi:hypothetical protein